MGLLSRIVATLIASATLAAGGAGPASGLQDTSVGDGDGTVSLTADTPATSTQNAPAGDASTLPDHLVNGDFEYPTADIMGKSDGEFWYISQNDNSWWANVKLTGKEKRSTLPAGFDKSKFAWHSTQTGDTHYPTLERADDVQVDYKGDGTNHYSEITAAQAGSTLYQDVATTPGVMYRWSLKHASINSANVDRMSVMIGEPGKETAQEATRTTVNGHGDKTGKVGTEIATKVSNSASDQWNHVGQWETYTGTYIATSTVTRFAFRSIEGGGKTQGEAWDGNLLDDVQFTKAYKLDYDKNASDASGSVPSKTEANTTQPASTSATGSVKTVADTNANNLPDHLINGDFDYKWPQLVTHMTAKYNFANIDPAHGDIEDGGELDKNGQASRKWTHIDGFDASQFGWKSTQTDSYVDGRGGIVEIQRARANDNMYAEVTASQAGTAIYQDINTQHDTATVYSVSLRYARRVTGVDSKERLQVMVGVPGHEAPVTMTRVKTGANPGNKVGYASTTMNAPNTNGWLGSWDTYKGKVVIPANQSVTRFTFKSSNSDSPTTGNLVDDIDFQMAYPLTYDKNAQDATGSVPSKTTENTVDPAKTNGTGSVKTVADSTSNLPDHLVNGDFEYPGGNAWMKLSGTADWTGISRKDGKIFAAKVNKWIDYPGLDSAAFAWDSTETGYGTPSAGNANAQLHTNEVELQVDSDTHNTYAELCAHQAGTAIYQDIATTPGVMYKISLKHTSQSKVHADGMQVLVGAPGQEAAVEMTRTADQSGLNKVGERSSTIVTKASNEGTIEGIGSRHHDGQWATYEGTYLATGTVTRFTFKSISSYKPDFGNLLDDISFEKAYSLSYDKNAADASGQVPSDSVENTLKPAASILKQADGNTVQTVADKTGGKLTVHDLETEDIPGNYRRFTLDTTKLDMGKVELEQGAWFKQVNAGSVYYWPLKLGAKATLRNVGTWTDTKGNNHTIDATLSVNEWNGGAVGTYTTTGNRFWIFSGSPTGHGGEGYPTQVTKALGEVDNTKRVGNRWDVRFTYADTGESVPDTFKGVTGFNDLDGLDAQPDLLYEGVELEDGFDGAYKMRDAELKAYGTNGFAGVKHDAGDEDNLNGEQQSKHRLSATWTGSGFTFDYSAYAGYMGNMKTTFGTPITRTEVLTYDKNAADAKGLIPSDTTPGETREVTAAKASDTEGSVGSLVQRITNNADGSSVVRTVDATTGVMQGCQVYYPAGQRITLATMAKDDDCWDSSMLQRPGYTQLGWNESSTAAEAEPEVTMRVGGMTVYAVWVDNPVLTYDTNKPLTWEGQMPTTPASVSVPYNTPATDKSGWVVNDTSKIKGYKFLGWYTGKDDNTPLYDWKTALTGNVTVYAHWERLTANVHYHKNADDATGEHAKTQGWQWDNVTIPGDVSKSFARTGYTLVGWNTQPDGKGTDYEDGGTVSLTDTDVHLYAKWKPVYRVIPSTGGTGLAIALGGGVILLVGGIAMAVMLTKRTRRDADRA